MTVTQQEDKVQPGQLLMHMQVTAHSASAEATNSPTSSSCSPSCLCQTSRVDQLVVCAGAYEEQHNCQERGEVEES